MYRKPPLGLFVTGTCTEVGKTYVAALIAKALKQAGYRVGAYKPVASGCVPRDGALVADDAVALWEACGRPATLEHVCPQRFALPVAPHRAARAEGRTVDPELLRQGLEFWTDHCEIVVIEGAGGLMSPISDEDYVADLACEWQYPALVVAANRLGVINATLQTLITAETFREGISVGGVILNDVEASGENAGPDADPSRESNLEELRERCVAPVLAHVRHGQTELPAEIDWRQLVAPSESRAENQAENQADR